MISWVRCTACGPVEAATWLGDAESGGCDMSVPESSANVSTRRVVVGVDGSPWSMDALRRALGFARSMDAALDVVLAWEYRPPAMSTSFDWDAAGRAAASAAAVEALSHCVQAVFGQAQAVPGAWKHKGVTVTATLVEGPPASVVCAAGQGADLLVVGSRGRSRVGALLLGSVSRHVVAHAPCPVLVVPWEHMQQEALLPDEIVPGQSTGAGPTSRTPGVAVGP
ncbi:MAG: universal stress protein [Frankiaceae bacterium]